MQKLGDFKLPPFFNYPPYFTLQPVRDTREKQIQLWKDLILDYCKTQKIFIIGLEEEFPLFSNHVIETLTSCDTAGSLTHEAREAFLSALVKDNALEDGGVVTVEEIRSGIESRGTELHGLDRTILMRALKLLEHKGKLAIFKGTSADDEGVKFSI
ncbi:hypothetical protein SAY87_014573 [Trapa incisa]|uniref:Vacuolar protein sorting-associated protein 25 n=1 Tax=Trapa incisa TaxID=236973 RepID=A0AAN7H2X6_9MYRT|nr:hypothetical protein SAY87_014573 [Trapa incisa]